jgi:hypothetical protein
MSKTDKPKDVASRPLPKERKKVKGLRRYYTEEVSDEKKEDEVIREGMEKKELVGLSPSKEQRRGRGRPPTGEPPRKIKNARIRIDYIELFRKSFLMRKIDEPGITEGKVFEEALELYFDKRGIEFKKELSFQEQKKLREILK